MTRFLQMLDMCPENVTRLLGVLSRNAPYFKFLFAPFFLHRNFIHPALIFSEFF
jgi:hypothetical protein